MRGDRPTSVESLFFGALSGVWHTSHDDASGLFKNVHEGQRRHDREDEEDEEAEEGEEGDRAPEWVCKDEKEAAGLKGVSHMEHWTTCGSLRNVHVGQGVLAMCRGSFESIAGLSIT